MGKLSDLRKLVSELFSTATEKTTIEKAAVVSNKIDELENEQNELIRKHSELLESYKDVIMHTSFKDAPSAGNIPASTMPSFEDMLNAYIKR